MINKTGLTGEALLDEAAHRVSVSPLLFFTDIDYGIAAARLLEKASAAFPVDFNEPPRNPRDRSLLLAVLGLASAIANRDHGFPV